MDEGTAVEWKVHHLLGINDGADRGVLALQENRAGGDFDGLRSLTDGEGDGEARDLIDDGARDARLGSRRGVTT